MGGNRAQAETIAVILIFGLVLTGALVVVVLGSGAIDETQDQISEDRAEKAMTQLDSKAALVALGNSDTQEVDFGVDRRSNYEVNEGEGWMRITIENQSDGSSTTLVNESLGTVSYEVNDNTIAYQGGGVWKRIGANESRMVSPPEFYFRNGTLTLPIVNVTGASSLGSKASVTKEETIEKYPTAGRTNPLDNHLVKVTVQSQYYKGWGRYFEERTDGEVEYDHSRNIVNLTLVSPLQKGKITAAASSLAASGDFVINGRASNHACPGPPISHYTDSYNSSVGDYCSQTPDDSGDIIYSGDVDIDQGAGGSEIRGDVVSGDTVFVRGGPGGGQPYVYGWINHTNACQTVGGPPSSSCSDRITDPSADNRSIDGVRTAPPINRFLQSTVDSIESSNDNGAAPISGDRLDFSASGPPTDVELSSGRYYLERIEFAGSGDRIEFNTSGGDVVIGVRGDVNMPTSAEMEVVGDGAVKMYVEGESSFSDGDGWTFDMEQQNTITTPDDTAAQFRIYGQENFTFRMGNDVNNELVGIIYAPPGTSGTGEVLLDKGNIYGGVLTGTTTINNQGSIHYDEALQGKRIISRDAKVLKITYLHVSVNRIRVD